MTRRITTSPAMRPYRMSSGRRDFIHGPIRPLHDPHATDLFTKLVPVGIAAAVIGAVILGGMA